MEPNRIGKATEYKKGHFYMTIVEWPDGHCEIEVHECVPVMLYHSCDIKDIDEAKKLFEKLADEEKRHLPILSKIPHGLLQKAGPVNE